MTRYDDDEDYGDDARPSKGGLERKRRGAVRAMDQLEKSIEQLKERVRTLEEHLDPFLRPEFPSDDGQKIAGEPDREPASSITVRLEDATLQAGRLFRRVDGIIERIDG